MVGSLNKVILIGNVGRDPEVRQTKDGKKIVSFSLATSERWRDRGNQEMRERTEWHRVVVFNDRLVDVITQYVHKGTQVYIEGQLQTRKWKDQTGQDRYTTEIVLGMYRGDLVLLARGGGGGDEFADGPDDGPMSRDHDFGVGGGQSGDDLDDDIPF